MSNVRLKSAVQTISSKRRHLLRRTAIGLLIVMLVGLWVSWIVAGRLAAPMPRVVGDPPSDLPVETISLDSESGSRIAGWHIRSKVANGVVVLLHGIRGCRLSMLKRGEFLHDAGYSVVMIDLQGHGESQGKAITLGHLESMDVRAAVDFAKEKHPGESIGVIGVSLGGASALLASPLGVDALIVESTYPDITVAVQNRVSDQLGLLASVPSWLLLVQLEPRLGVSPNDLRPIDHVSQVECPIFLISGADDVHTTPEETRQMFEIANEPKALWIVPGAAHIDLHETASDEYESRILSFLERHCSRISGTVESFRIGEKN